MDMTEKNNNKNGRLFVVRGVPGSGRHTTAYRMAEQINALVVSVDFFLNIDVENAEFASDEQIEKARIVALTVMKYAISNGAKNIVFVDTAPTYLELSDIFMTFIEELKQADVNVLDIPCLDFEKCYQFATKYSYNTLKNIYQDFTSWESIVRANEQIKPFNTKIAQVNFDSQKDIEKFFDELQENDRETVASAIMVLYGINYCHEKTKENDNKKNENRKKINDDKIDCKKTRMTKSYKTAKKKTGRQNKEKEDD